MCEKEDLEWTQEAFHAEQQDLITHQCHLLRLHWQEEGRSRPKVQSWAKIQLANDAKRGRVAGVRVCPRSLPRGFRHRGWAPVKALDVPAKKADGERKRERERGGKRVAKNRGQTGSCGEQKSQTKAHLGIAEPRGWKRIPPRVIVSHVLLPPCNIFQINAHSSLLYSEDKLQFHREKKRPELPQKGNWFFFSTAHEIMSCRLCCTRQLNCQSTVPFSFFAPTLTLMTGV